MTNKNNNEQDAFEVVLISIKENLKSIDFNNTNIVSNHIRHGYYEFCLTMIDYLVPSRLGYLKNLRLYKASRLPLLKSLLHLRQVESNPNANGEQVREYIEKAFIEFSCIYLELKKDGQVNENLNARYKPLEEEMWDNEPNILHQISTFKGYLHSQFDTAKSSQMLQDLERKIETLTADLEMATLLQASKVMTKTWSDRETALNFPRRTLIAGTILLLALTLTWPLIAYLWLLDHVGNNENIDKLFANSYLPDRFILYLSIFAITQSMLIYFFRVVRQELAKVISKTDCHKHRRSLSDFMASYIEYLGGKNIDPSPTIKLFDEAIIAHRGDPETTAEELKTPTVVNLPNISIKASKPEN